MQRRRLLYLDFFLYAIPAHAAPKAWRVLDTVIGLTMAALAAKLLRRAEARPDNLSAPDPGAAGHNANGAR